MIKLNPANLWLITDTDINPLRLIKYGSARACDKLVSGKLYYIETKMLLNWKAMDYLKENNWFDILYYGDVYLIKNIKYIESVSEYQSDLIVRIEFEVV